jgi:cardiolipin synthase A/B
VVKVPLRGGHRLHLLEGGGELFPAMIRAMEHARELVHVETYIFEFAGSALQVAEAMERAARRGVRVRLVVDGVGTPGLPRLWRERFEQAGVQCRVYQPLGHVGLFIPSRWRRLHRKLCVVDGELGFCGGINLIDDLDDLALGRLERPRLDYALQVSGPLVADMLDSMEQLWWRMQAVSRVRQHEFRAAWDALRAGRMARPAGLSGVGKKAQQAALLLRDNVHHRYDIERAYLKAIARARREIVIANAYFIPGRKLRRALMLAAARGVRVRLLLHGRYEHFLQYHAARPVYHWLLEAGIEIHEYAPSALHAKVAVVDDAWATVGSTNLDPLSLLLAREANVVTRDRVFARGLWQRLDLLLRTAGERVEPEGLQGRPWHQRLFDRLAFGVMRGLLFLLGQRY